MESLVIINIPTTVDHCNSIIIHLISVFSPNYTLSITLVLTLYFTQIVHKSSIYLYKHEN